MNEGNAILVIEDEVTAREEHRYLPPPRGYDAEHAPDAEQGLARLETFRPDVIVLDYNLPGMDGLAALRAIREVDARVKVIMLTGHGSVRIAVEAMRSTAYDYLPKPVVLSELKALIAKAIGDERRDEALSHAEGPGGTGLDAIVGDSPAIVALKDTIRTLVTGERGTRGATAGAGDGRDRHRQGTGRSRRALRGRARLAPVRRDQLRLDPGKLLESELFGHERGAFTDARERKIGLIEAADGGTLFLDEIGDMELALQVKLLRVLEERVIRRLGSVRDRTVDVRIVSATNRPLEALVATGSFRSDLLFRLRIVSLACAAATRARRRLRCCSPGTSSARFAANYGRRGMLLLPDAEQAIRAHAWPGNVRELRNVVEQAVLLASLPEITAEMLRIVPAPSQTLPATAGTSAGHSRTSSARCSATRSSARCGTCREPRRCLACRATRFGIGWSSSACGVRASTGDVTDGADGQNA